MNTSDFHYSLPPELIAQYPLECRSDSGLLVLDRGTGGIEHMRFVDIVDLLDENDCLVLNDTKVIPARLVGVKEGTDYPMEFVLLKRINGDIWEVIVRPGKRAKPGARFSFGSGLLTAEVTDIIEGGNRLVRMEYDGVFEKILDSAGVMPLPPYITEKSADPERYQTVYAKHRGSAAAPTAGLHFTEEILERVQEKGVKIARITLHVGLGTFRPVKVMNIEDHVMHKEFYSVNGEAAEVINSCKGRMGRIIAVGTTSARVLETVSDTAGMIHESSGETGIFIYPGYKFKSVDAVITNFHLPESTLIMLVSAFAGRENLLRAYNTAIEKKYRFYSFGDAMFIK